MGACSSKKSIYTNASIDIYPKLRKQIPTEGSTDRLNDNMQNEQVNRQSNINEEVNDPFKDHQSHYLNNAENNSEFDKTGGEFKNIDGDSLMQLGLRSKQMKQVGSLEDWNNHTIDDQLRNYKLGINTTKNNIIINIKENEQEKQLPKRNKNTSDMYLSKTEKKQINQARISSGLGGISYDLENLVRDQNYLSIPNNFKNKVGVAFATTEANIMMDAGLSGIYNMGNTCFLSTAIQCLCAVQPLTDFFLGDLHEQSINKTNPMGSLGEVSFQYANLLKDIWKGKEDKIYPMKILKKLHELAPHLVSGQQQDAQEFLAYLLDILHEDLNRADKFNNLKKQREELDLKKSLALTQQESEYQENFAEYTDEQQELIAYDAWKEHLFNNRSIIVDLFQGQLKSALRCLNCGHTSIKFDSFMYLSIPIPAQFQNKHPTLEECVEEFTKEEILDGENKWKCLKCKSFQRATKKIDIWKLPSILIVHLKRFEFSERKRGKINDFVDFPLDNLDLTPYVSKLQREKPIYDLFAVSNHEGYLGGGHYYAYTKHRKNHMWYQFDDDMVKHMPDEENVVTPAAYILFYSKMTVDEFARQTLSEPGLWPHLIFSEKTKLNSINGARRIPNVNYQSPKSIFDVPIYKPSPNLLDLKLKNTQMKVSGHGLGKIGSSLLQRNSMGLQMDSSAEYKDRNSIISQSGQKSIFTPQRQSHNGYFKTNTQDNMNTIEPNILSSRGIPPSSSIIEGKSDYSAQSKRAYGYSQITQQKATGKMIMENSGNKQIVINNNNNNYYINLYMRGDGQY